MRKLVWSLICLTLLACGWWALTMWSLARGVDSWLEMRRAEGWQAEVSAQARGGFPRAARLTLKDLALADPQTGVALRADHLTLAARTLWPGDVALTLPDTPLELASPAAKVSLGFESGRADLNLAPGPALDLDNLSFASAGLDVRSPAGDILRASRIEMRMARKAGTDAEYDIVLTLDAPSPGEVLRRAWLIPESWPRALDALALRAAVRFDRPWGLPALQDARPQPQRIELERAELLWGPVQVHLTGVLDVDALGVPRGSVTLRAQNWEALLEIAAQMGVLPPAQRDLVERVLRSLAAGSGRTEDLDVTLRFADGRIRLGFVPLGPAPILRLR